MSFRSRNAPCLDCWYWQGFRIRCALLPDEPRLLDAHWAQGLQLVEHGRIAPWRMAATTLNLLLDSACDPALPWHWRAICLDQSYRSLQILQGLADRREQHQTLNRLRNRLATLRLQPSLSTAELAEGNPYE
ncbi:FagA protein [Stutzerimonas kirkiae]|uniref:FagA protein n=1 Tax=Stutzerimonas kirkiae TaxID=2211392 RepID=A0A4Q9RBT1_9GAMM|nr:FagA protein [Stutzerimonas kirkiae]TBU98172.1 FagA protein [Stutzerimonas kirkiae]TBV02313.1 FagA protein [Stutzerimonas kirkiae]TBV11223.1 FagA protein [Stutzerimonas kirkiae]TBV14624.1 FagA protein [Stutzerimonas kirkiae]